MRTYIDSCTESIEGLLHIADGTLDSSQVPLDHVGGDSKDGHSQQGLSDQGELHFDLWVVFLSNTKISKDIKSPGQVGQTSA